MYRDLTLRDTRAARRLGHPLWDMSPYLFCKGRVRAANRDCHHADP